MFLVSFWVHFLGTFVVYSSVSLILVTLAFLIILVGFDFRMMFSFVRLSYCSLKLLSSSPLFESVEF